jgi:predicted HicB family RNase H-like nuclease
MGGKTSATSKNKWAAKAYDRIITLVKKGRKEVITSHAAGRGESVNAFVNRAIDEAMDRDGCKRAGAPLP